MPYYFGLGKDPEVKTKVQQVKLYMDLLATGPAWDEDLDRVWGQLHDGVASAKSPWAKARGPIQSMMVALESLGWKLHTPTF